MNKPIILLFILLPYLLLAQQRTSHDILNDGNKKSLSNKEAFSLTGQLLNITSTSDSLSRHKSKEKLYLQLDKPYYSVGDTLWFKAYLLNQINLEASQRSVVIYTDITNDSNKVVKRYKWAVREGISQGCITLNENFLPGTYTLRSYTNWMRNWGEECFFSQIFFVTGKNENVWLVAKQLNLKNGVDGIFARVKLRFSDFNDVPAAIEPIQLTIKSGSKNLYKQKIKTGVDGSINVSFKLPENTQAIKLIAENEQKNKKSIIPLIVDRPNHTDVQFLPEGGDLVAGWPAHIGFKAIGEDGEGVNVSGVILDSAGHVASVFNAAHNGMGSFDLTVREGDSYNAKITLPDGSEKIYPLPSVKSSGTILQVKNNIESDSVKLLIGITNNTAQLPQNYFLVGSARGIVCYAAIIYLKNGECINKKIAKGLFPTGVVKFTLMNTSRQPLNERMFFIDHDDELQIKYAGKSNYNINDSIPFCLKITDRKGNPVKGNFSMSVTDDAQIKINSNSENIQSLFLLTSELKGNIEGPGYYYPAKTNEKWQALDNLLLTQGWIRYDWQQKFNSFKPQFEPEQTLKVSGTVTNLFNKPLANVSVILFSKTPSFLLDTITDDHGRFYFNKLPPSETAVYVLQAKNKNGKSFNVNVTPDETAPPVFTEIREHPKEPWFVNSDTTLLNFTKLNAQARDSQYDAKGFRLLKEVKITAKKIIKDSQNLNGPGNADVVIDEMELEAAGKKTFLDILREKIPGFKEGFFLLSGIPTLNSKVYRDRILASFIEDNSISTDINQYWYFINDKPIKFFIDGISLYQVRGMTLPALTNINNYLNSHSAEDIKGIEVISSTKYSLKYIPVEWGMLVSPADVAFVEITTRSGSGPGIHNTPGIYLYKPLPLSFAKQFYQPKYKVSDTVGHQPDLRSTIEWEPNISTNKNGEATVSFYAADKPSTYTIIVEGTDTDGRLGYYRGKITVANK